ncbi:MAG: M48 family metallopeptidase [Burkholderiales bacterium]
MPRLLDRLKSRLRNAAVPTELHVGELRIEVLRKPIRTLTLRVYPPDGCVRVSAPWRASDESIRGIVAGKLAWIRRHRARIAAAPPALPPEPLTPAHRADLKRRIPPLRKKWESALGVQAAAWGVKRMKTRWGSCSIHARRIWLNLELARYPEACLDYVVLHEVAHLIERGHGARFKALLGMHMPDWKARQALLRGPPA